MKKPVAVYVFEQEMLIGLEGDYWFYWVGRNSIKSRIYRVYRGDWQYIEVKPSFFANYFPHIYKIIQEIKQGKHTENRIMSKPK